MDNDMFLHDNGKKYCSVVVIAVMFLRFDVEV